VRRIDEMKLANLGARSGGRCDHDSFATRWRRQTMRTHAQAIVPHFQNMCFCLCALLNSVDIIA